MGTGLVKGQTIILPPKSIKIHKICAHTYYVHIYIYVCVCTHMCAWVCIYVCVYICVYKYICVCVCMYVICIAFLQMFPSSNSGPMALFLSPDALDEEGSHGFQIPALHLLKHCSQPCAARAWRSPKRWKLFCHVSQCVSNKFLAVLIPRMMDVSLSFLAATLL